MYRYWRDVSAKGPKYVTVELLLRRELTKSPIRSASTALDDEGVRDQNLGLGLHARQLRWSSRTVA
jgi:hypothetical protein